MWQNWTQKEIKGIGIALIIIEALGILMGLMMFGDIGISCGHIYQDAIRLPGKHRNMESLTGASPFQISVGRGRYCLESITGFTGTGRIPGYAPGMGCYPPWHQEVHKDDADSAPDGSNALKLIKDAQRALAVPGSYLDVFTALMCTQLQVRYEKLTEQERTVLKNVKKKSPAYKDSPLSRMKRR